MVFGASASGTGLAFLLARAGHAVEIVETDAGAVERAEQALNRLNREMPPGPDTTRLPEVRIGDGYATPAEIIIEALAEGPEAAAETLAALEKQASEGCLLLSTTSIVHRAELARGLARPERLVGLHLYPPVHRTDLIEVALAVDAPKPLRETMAHFAGALGRIAVPVGADGHYLGPRLAARLHDAANAILLAGGLPWEIDEAMLEFGFAMGPFLAEDYAGLDLGHAVRKLRTARSVPQSPVTIADRMVAEGRLGWKVGVGWYRFPGGGGPVIDPLIEDMIVEEARFAKITRRPVAPEAARDGLIAALVDEAVAMLADGTARNEADIDLVSIHGFGFPAALGGLMTYAKEIGGRRIRADLDRFSAP